MKKYILKITLCIALFFTLLFVSSLKNRTDNVDYNTEENNTKKAIDYEYTFKEEISESSKTLEEIVNKNNTIESNINIKDTIENKNKIQEIPNIDTQDNVSSKQISINSFLKNIDYKKVSLKPKETLSIIANDYTSTCNPNTTINLIKLLNNLTDVDNLDEGTVLLIPDKALKSGSLYKVKKGNTWHNIWETKYSKYDRDQLIRLLITINALPNDDLPIDENIFLPKL